jgi:hypothetical protein
MSKKVTAREEEMIVLKSNEMFASLRNDLQILPASSFVAFQKDECFRFN